MFEMQYFLASAPAVIAFVRSLPPRSFLGRFSLKRPDRGTTRRVAEAADTQVRHPGLSL